MRTTICPDDHKHGQTPTCYRGHRCACGSCREANRARIAEFRKLRAYGRPTSTLLPSGPVLEHLEKLRAAGMRPATIAAAADIQYTTVKHLLGYGELPVAQRPRVFRTTAEKILAVTTDPQNFLAGHWVDSRGARRRLQALGTRGWALAVLARRMGLTNHRLISALERPRVSTTTHIAIAEIFDELWDQDAPATTFGERLARTIALQRAEQGGWLPALAWDDIDSDPAPAQPTRQEGLVDSIAIELALRGEVVSLSERERAVVIAQGHYETIAPVLGLSSRHVLRLRKAA